MGIPIDSPLISIWVARVLLPEEVTDAKPCVKSMPMRIFEPRLRAVSLFVLCYMAAGLAFIAYQQNLEFVFYGAMMIGFIWLVLFMDRRVCFHSMTLWLLAIWGLLHLAGGNVPIPQSIAEPGHSGALYNMRLAPWLPKFDQIVHAFGFASATLASYEAISAHFGRALVLRFPVLVFLFLVAMGLGAMNEVVEFAAVLLMPETNVGDYRNNSWDLVCNGIGSFLMLAWLKLGGERVLAR